jgi:hypothetical protein
MAVKKRCREYRLLSQSDGVCVFDLIWGDSRKKYDSSLGRRARFEGIYQSNNRDKGAYKINMPYSSTLSQSVRYHFGILNEQV